MPTGVDIQSWENSISLENVCLNDINWEETYIIYDFITDPVKKEQIKTAVIKYISMKKLSELKLEPLYLYLHSSKENHYVTNLSDIADKYSNFRKAEIEGYILTEQLPNTIPLYEYYHDGGFDHYTTTLPNIHNQFKGWVRLRTAGYVYKNIQMETVPLFEYWAERDPDHYTTTHSDICQNWTGWVQLTNPSSGYVFPAD